MTLVERRRTTLNGELCVYLIYYYNITTIVYVSNNMCMCVQMTATRFKLRTKLTSVARLCAKLRSTTPSRQVAAGHGSLSLSAVRLAPFHRHSRSRRVYIAVCTSACGHCSHKHTYTPTHTPAYKFHYSSAPACVHKIFIIF